jgi:hypothetical protein
VYEAVSNSDPPESSYRSTRVCPCRLNCGTDCWLIFAKLFTTCLPVEVTRSPYSVVTVNIKKLDLSFSLRWIWRLGVLGCSAVYFGEADVSEENIITMFMTEEQAKQEVSRRRREAERKMEAICSSETSESLRTTRRYNPEYRSLQVSRCYSSEQHKYHCVLLEFCMARNGQHIWEYVF